MSTIVQEGICPNHGLVLARRNNRYDAIGWMVALMSGFQWSDRTPYRCPTCGRLTTKAAPIPDEGSKR